MRPARPRLPVSVWRHLLRGVPLRYDSALWSGVFPLGMYSVAGTYLGRANDLPVVSWVGAAELWVALAAWVLVFFLGMLPHLAVHLFWPRTDARPGRLRFGPS